MPFTHGKKVQFNWFLKNEKLTISNQKGRTHEYSLDEIFKVLRWLEKEFGQSWFSLANNVAKLGKGTEKPGLGSAILEIAPGDISHAQGSSYLGVVLEEVGLLQWNGARKGIKWRIVHKVQNEQDLRHILESESK